MKNRHLPFPLRLFPVAAVVVLAILASSLYIPYLQNALVFDDHNLFTTLAVFDFAQTPFNFGPRHFPYFTLGFVHVMTGSIPANRVVNLGLHIACAAMVFALARALFREVVDRSTFPAVTGQQPAYHADALALVAAAWFVLNPVAVYGAGYLVQRTVLFTTLFSLLSLWFFRRAFAENRAMDVVTAALFYSLAVLSKEHAIMLPLATVSLVMLSEAEWRIKARRAVIYLVLCTPAALLVLANARGVVATGYEPYVMEVQSQVHGIPLMNSSFGRWLVSALLQAGAFLDYWRYWLIPDVRQLSADIRVDFSALWQQWWWLIPKVLAFLACPVVAAIALRRGKLAALFGFGLLYFWCLYLTELSAVRIQEPFVLYRSYLWAPGIALMLLALIGRFRLPYFAVAFLAIAPLLFMLAQDRLDSMKTEFTVWDDAARKLTSPDLPGADRIYYNRGGEYFKSNRLDVAMKDLDRVVELNPRAFQGYLGRGMIYLKMQDYSQALTQFDRSLAINPGFGFALFRRGLSLEGLGRMEEAMQAYAAADKAGDTLARMRLTYLREKKAL